MGYTEEMMDCLKIQIKDKFPKLIESQKELTKEYRTSNAIKILELEMQLGLISREEAKNSLKEIKEKYLLETNQEQSTKGRFFR